MRTLANRRKFLATLAWVTGFIGIISGTVAILLPLFVFEECKKLDACLMIFGGIVLICFSIMWLLPKANCLIDEAVLLKKGANLKVKRKYGIVLTSKELDVLIEALLLAREVLDTSEDEDQVLSDLISQKKIR